MKLQILRVCALLVSISAASCGPMMSPDDVKKLDGKGVYDFITPVDGIPQPAKSRDLMSSSKSIDAILTPSDLEGLREGHKAQNRQSIDLIPSTKSPHRLIEPKDLEKMIEDKKQKSNNIEDVLQEEDPFSPTKKEEK